jgi:hypothetical protein
VLKKMKNVYSSPAALPELGLTNPEIIRSDILAANADSFTQIILRLLNMNHQNAK